MPIEKFVQELSKFKGENSISLSLYQKKPDNRSELYSLYLERIKRYLPYVKSNDSFYGGIFDCDKIK